MILKCPECQSKYIGVISVQSKTKHDQTVNLKCKECGCEFKDEVKK